MNLANLVNNEFDIINGGYRNAENQDKLIRSKRMLLFDLKRWGYTHKPNSSRPYFLGHERKDVVLLLKIS